MKGRILKFIFLLLLCNLCPLKAQPPIRFESQAENWMQALPVGNGRMGAMVFGRTDTERIQLNEDSLWPGGPDWGESRGNRADLDTLRLLLDQGKTALVDSLIVERFSHKWITRSHQTGGDLYIEFEKDREITDYERSLDLQNAIVKNRYKADGYEFVQEVWASNPDNLLVVHLSTQDPKGMHLNLRMDRPKDEGFPTVNVSSPARDQLLMKGMVTQRRGVFISEPKPLDYGVRFATLLQVQNTGGRIRSKNGELMVSGARELTLLIATATSFYHSDFEEVVRKTMASIVGTSIDEMRRRHIEDYSTLYNRVSFDLGNTIQQMKTTEQRLKQVRAGIPDPILTQQLFQYGRYLLIASSRPGALPANLQGIWNEHIQAPWNADYHLNINLQMNYWPAEVANLSELHQPYFDFIDRVIARGEKTARQQYQMDGSVVHHTTDIWAPAWMRAARPYWGSWIHGGGWSVQHYWEHFLFTRDTQFLKDRAYPNLKKIAAFYADWLVWDSSSGRWISSPETSPENSYFTSERDSAAVSRGSAMGHQIIGIVFDQFLEASEVLGEENYLTERVRQKRKNLFSGTRIGPDGRLLEWNLPYEEPEQGHRHISHLFGVHPGNTITSAQPELMAAARKSRDFRLEHGGAGTGWSRAWMINMDARLLDAVSAEENIRKFMEISLADNLFDMHPPFQIDGNFGFTAGLIECLLQSHEGYIRILPALPDFWPDGEIKGIKARGNVTVDISWKGGRLEKVGLLAGQEDTFKIQYNGRFKSVDLKPGEKLWINASDLE